MTATILQRGAGCLGVAILAAVVVAGTAPEVGRLRLEANTRLCIHVEGEEASNGAQIILGAAVSASATAQEWAVASDGSIQVWENSLSEKD